MPKRPPARRLQINVPAATTVTGWGRTRYSEFLSHSVLVDGEVLRHQMRLRGLTAVELARLSRDSGQRVSEATISHAINGHRIHPSKLVSIAAVLHSVEPLPGVESPLQAESARVL